MDAESGGVVTKTRFKGYSYHKVIENHRNQKLGVLVHRKPKGYEEWLAKQLKFAREFIEKYPDEAAKVRLEYERGNWRIVAIK